MTVYIDECYSFYSLELYNKDLICIKSDLLTLRDVGCLCSVALIGSVFFTSCHSNKESLVLL